MRERGQRQWEPFQLGGQYQALPHFLWTRGQAATGATSSSAQCRSPPQGMPDSCWSALCSPSLDQLEWTSGKIPRRRHEGQPQSVRLCGLGFWSAGTTGAFVLHVAACVVVPPEGLLRYVGGRCCWRCRPRVWRMRLVTGEQVVLRFSVSCAGAWVGSIV